MCRCHGFCWVMQAGVRAEPGAQHSPPLHVAPLPRPPPPLQDSGTLAVGDPVEVLSRREGVLQPTAA